MLLTMTMTQRQMTILVYMTQTMTLTHQICVLAVQALLVWKAMKPKRATFGCIVSVDVGFMFVVRMMTA